jgi:3-deoxy-7-phosphoheptulonate synthase
MRAILASGFASLNQPRQWSLSHVRSPALRKEFEAIVSGLTDAVEFSRTIGLETGKESTISYERGGGLGAFGVVDLYTRYTAYILDIYCTF